MASGEMQREDGTVEYPFGKDAIGFLAYTIDDLVWFEVSSGVVGLVGLIVVSCALFGWLI